MIECLEDFAAQWGADPCYVREPNLPGDGYLFYNFAAEQDDPEFRRTFIPAIERTIEFAKLKCEPADVDDLQEFLGRVREMEQTS
jgi:hypothetical protein